MVLPQVITLLGRGALDSSLICLASLQRYAEENFNLTIFDDSSLTAEDLCKIRSTLKVHRIVSKQERDRSVIENLKDYPRCKAFRERNVLAHKLIDLFLFSEQEHIQYIDSDVLFLRSFSGFPIINAGIEPIFMADLQSAYSISPLHMFRNKKLNLPRTINTGMIIYPKLAFDLDLIETFLEEYAGQDCFESSSCWAEQTCWALLAGRGKCMIWDPRQIMIAHPKNLKAVSNDTIGIHFVSSYRDRLFDYLKMCDLNSAPPVEINTSLSPKLGAFEFVLERMGNRLTHAFSSLK